MNKFLKIFIFSLLAAFSTAVAAVNWYLFDVFFADDFTFSRLKQEVIANTLIRKPEGDGPFPTVLLFHGCGGMKPGSMDFRINKFVETDTGQSESP